MLNKLHDLVYRNPILTAVAVAAGLTVLFVAIAWFTASSVTSLPKAEELNKQSANAHVESVKSEGNANVTAAQVNAVDANRQEAIRISRAASEAAKKEVETLNKRKAEYEKVRNTKRPVNGADLDARERQLQSDLDKLYPDH